MMDNLKEVMDHPKDLLSLLETINNPRKLMSSEIGVINMMHDVYTALFQAVWTGDKKTARQMILSLVRLEDAVISSLATFTIKKKPTKKGPEPSSK